MGKEGGIGAIVISVDCDFQRGDPRVGEGLKPAGFSLSNTP